MAFRILVVLEVAGFIYSMVNASADAVVQVSAVYDKVVATDSTSSGSGTADSTQRSVFRDEQIAPNPRDRYTARISGAIGDVLAAEKIALMSAAT